MGSLRLLLPSVLDVRLGQLDRVGVGFEQFSEIDLAGAAQASERRPEPGDLRDGRRVGARHHANQLAQVVRGVEPVAFGEQLEQLQFLEEEQVEAAW